MDGNSPSLAVRLMQVAADYELEKKAEREALEREIDRLHERNRDLDRRVWSQNKQIEEMGQKLSEVTSEMQKRTQSVDEHIDALTRELIAVKFAFADCVKLLERIRRNHEDLPEFQSAPGYLEDMARDADLHSRDMLYLAAEEGLEEIVKSILSPTCSSHDELAETFGYAVNRAAGAGHLGIMKHLLAVGANPFAVSEDDYTLRTALHRTASAGHEHIVRYLLDKASSLINSQDVHGCTALHVAVAGGHAHVVKHLLLAGCDVDIRNDSGETALDVSKKTKSAAVQSVLQDATVRFWNCSVRANKLYSDKLFDGAIKCYSEAIELAPEGSVATSRRDLATLHYNRARASYRLGFHCNAIDDCTTALDHDSTYRNALAQRAECHMALFDFDAAVSDFQSLLDMNPEDRQWLRRLHDARTMRDLSHYELLGVPVDASPAVIKKAYRQQCLKWHPDKHNRSKEDIARATIAFKRINEANDVLTDSYKRMVYDVQVNSGRRSSSSHSFAAWFQKEKEREQSRQEEIEAVKRQVQEEQAAAKARRSHFLQLLRQYEREEAERSQPRYHVETKQASPADAPKSRQSNPAFEIPLGEDAIHKHVLSRASNAVARAEAELAAVASASAPMGQSPSLRRTQSEHDSDFEREGAAPSNAKPNENCASESNATAAASAGQAAGKTPRPASKRHLFSNIPHSYASPRSPFAHELHMSGLSGNDDSFKTGLQGEDFEHLSRVDISGISGSSDYVPGLDGDVSGSTDSDLEDLEGEERTDKLFERAERLAHRHRSQASAGAV